MKKANLATDSALQLLLPELHQAPKPALWLADENLAIETIPAPIAGISVISNRFDLAQAFKDKGWICEFNDYASPNLTNKFNSVLFRVSKEKAQTHHFINYALQNLTPGGELIFTGMKQEGIKGYFDRIDDLDLANKIERWKSDKQTWAGRVQISEQPEQLLDDKAYAELRLAAQDAQLNFYSKPGVFGWDKIDKGSELLIEHLKELVPNSVEADCALDLGCGYGYLSAHTAQQLNCDIIATDNNAAAIAACMENFKQFGINGQVIASDCAEQIQQKFPLIICNPPFHSGFSTSGDLTDRFLKSIAQHLTPRGIAILVTNLHIPAERKAASLFKHCDTPVVTKHFKLVRLSLSSIK